MIEALGNIEKVYIASQTFSHAQALADTGSNTLALDSIQEAISKADIVCLCTSSAEPVIQKDWVKPGTHISSVGYRPPGGELPRDLIEASHVFVESKVAFNEPPVGCSELQGLNPDFGTELGELFLNQKDGRRNENEITIYKSMGHAMEDLVAANLVYQKAIEKNIGKQIDL